MKAFNFISGILNILFALFWIMTGIMVISGVTVAPLTIFFGLLIAAISFFEDAIRNFIDFSKK